MMKYEHLVVVPDDLDTTNPRVAMSVLGLRGNFSVRNMENSHTVLEGHSIREVTLVNMNMSDLYSQLDNAIFNASAQFRIEKDCKYSSIFTTVRIDPISRGIHNSIVAVDFDGTICKHAFPKLGDPVPGAIEGLRKLMKQGNKIVIWNQLH